MAFKYERFLVEAIEQFHFHKIITYVKHGHNIHIKNNRGENLLIYLLKQQHHDLLFEKKRFQIFQFLIIQCHLDVQTFDYNGKNLFNWTTNLNCTQEALYLLRSYPGDIDILTRDQSGSCSLHYAIEHGNEILIHAIVDYLLQYRMRFDIKDGYNNTPEELARKLGYDHIGDYLAERSRSTIFLSREIPSLQQQRILSNKSKTTINTKSSSMTLLSSSSVLDPLEFYTLMESKIETAKVLNDWKTVAALRAYKRNSNGKRFNQLPLPTPQVNTTTTSSDSLKFPLINLKPSSGAQSAHMLRLIQPQLSTSYRQAFIPHYQRPLVPIVGLLPPSMGQRKMSTVSSRRMSSVMSMRKRESNASQIGTLTGPDGQLRLSLPPTFKQHRQSIVAGRLSDTDALMKLHAKNIITVRN